MNWTEYERFILTLLSLVFLVGLGHIITYVSLIYADKYQNKTRRAFLMRTQRYLGTFWWMFLIAVLTGLFGLVGGLIASTVLSFIALREFITLTPVKIGDHRALSIAFFVLIPLQYILIGFSEFGLFTVLIPVYAFLLLPVITVIRQDTDRFLTRNASLQWGLMVTVYCISHMVAILNIETVQGFSNGRRALFLLFFLVLVRASALSQHVADYYLRNASRRIAEPINSRYTWNGLIISAAFAAILGASLAWLTPLDSWQAFIAGGLIAVSSVMGRLVMRGIAMSMGIRDWGDVTGREQGVLDRLDGVIYAAPVFFHFVQFVIISF